MNVELPKLYLTGCTGVTNFYQGILNGVDRNKVIVFRPFDTLMASFVILKSKNTDVWIMNFAEKINQSWRVVMLAGSPSVYYDVNEEEEEILIDVREKDGKPLTYKDADEFGTLLIDSLSNSDVTLYSEYVLSIKVAI